MIKVGDEQHRPYLPRLKWLLWTLSQGHSLKVSRSRSFYQGVSFQVSLLRPFSQGLFLKVPQDISLLVSLCQGHFLSQGLSLSKSLTRTLCQGHSLQLFPSNSFPQGLSLSRSLAQGHSLKVTLSRSHSLSRSFAQGHSLIGSLKVSLSIKVSVKISSSLKLSQALSLKVSISISLGAYMERWETATGLWLERKVKKKMGRRHKKKTQTNSSLVFCIGTPSMWWHSIVPLCIRLVALLYSGMGHLQNTLPKIMGIPLILTPQWKRSWGIPLVLAVGMNWDLWGLVDRIG